MKMYMRFTCVATVTTAGNLLSPTYFIAYIYTKAIFFDMCYGTIFMLCVLNNDIISSYVRSTT